jgi:hypothetical protein
MDILRTCTFAVKTRINLRLNHLDFPMQWATQVGILEDVPSIF